MATRDRKPRCSVRSRRELLAEVAYYNVAQDGLGARFASAVEEATVRALAFPFAGSPSPASTRRVLVKDFPVSLFYRPEDGGIVIFAIANHARLPGYWRGRAR